MPPTKKNKTKKIAAAVGALALAGVAATAYSRHQNSGLRDLGLRHLKSEMSFASYIRDEKKAGRHIYTRNPHLPDSPIHHDMRFGDFPNRPPRPQYESYEHKKKTEDFFNKPRKHKLTPPSPKKFFHGGIKDIKLHSPVGDPFDDFYKSMA